MTIAESTRNKILALAWWYEGKPHNPYLSPGADQTQLPQEIESELAEPRFSFLLSSFEEIYNARRESSASSSRSSSESQAKRQKVAGQLPNALKRHWEVLCACSRSQNEALFRRAKGRALRGLVTKSEGMMKLPRAVNELVFSLLKAQDLCVLSECSTDLNYQLKNNVPKIWEKLGRDFGLPEDYWPDKAYSKAKCLVNLDLIACANRTLGEYTKEGHPFLPSIREWSHRSTEQLRSDLVDPQERFTRHTRPIMRAILADSPALPWHLTPHWHRTPYFFKLFDVYRKKELYFRDPCHVVNLFWTCGFPKTRSVFGFMIGEFADLRSANAEFANQAPVWLKTLSWMVGWIPQWAEDNRMSVYHPILQLGNNEWRTVPREEYRKVANLTFQLMRKGGIEKPDLIMLLHRILPLAFLKPTAEAMKDKSEIPTCLDSFFDRCFRDDVGYVHTHTPAEVLKAFEIFKGPAGWDTAQLAHLAHVEPAWIYEAAKTRSLLLVKLLFGMGIKYEWHPTHEWQSPQHSLTIALRQKASLEVIKFMRHECEIPPTAETVSLIDAYSGDPEVRGQLRSILGVQ